MPFILSHFLVLAHTLSLLLPRSWTTQTEILVCSSCSPAVARVCVTLFPHGYDWGGPHRDPSSLVSFSPAPFFPTSFSSLCSCPSKNRRGMAFVSSAGVPVGWKGARRLWLPTVGRGRLFSLGSPTCGRSWPTWVSQSLLGYRTFVAECFYSLCG